MTDYFTFQTFLIGFGIIFGIVSFVKKLFQLAMLRNKELSDWARGIMPYMEDWSKIKFELTDLKKQLDTAEDTLYAIALIMNETEELLPQVIEDNPFMQNVLDELRKYYGEEQ